VVAIPDATPGISGIREAEAFAHLPSPPNGDVGRVAHLVLMALLPSLADDDIVTFGRALTEIQEITGRWFASVQGGMFTPGPSATLVHRMREWGANGVGQSSWGPTVYGIVNGDEEAGRLSARVRDALGAAGVVYEGPFRSSGARVWREPFASNESEG
jgi:beta-RFAP synthase